MAKDNRFLRLENVTLDWVKIKRPAQNTNDDGTPKLEYTLNAHVTDEQVEALKKAGTYGIAKRSLSAMRDRVEEGKAKYLTFRKPVYTRSGDKTKTPKVVFTDGTIHDGYVGNGSTGDVILSYYDYETPKGKGTAIRLEAVVLKDLVEYSNDESDDALSVYGIKVKNSTTNTETYEDDDEVI